MFKDDEKETKEVWQPFGNTSPLAVMLKQQQAFPLVCSSACIIRVIRHTARTTSRVLRPLPYHLSC
jgi:hypothetical protein